MSGFQFLTPEIQVPEEWSVEAGRKMFTDIAKKAITLHHSGQRVIVSIDGMSALVTDDKNQRGYRFERIEEV